MLLQKDRDPNRRWQGHPGPSASGSNSSERAAGAKARPASRRLALIQLKVYPPRVSYMKDAQQKWRFLTNYDLSSIKTALFNGENALEHLGGTAETRR